MTRPSGVAAMHRTVPPCPASVTTSPVNGRAFLRASQRRRAHGTSTPARCRGRAVAGEHEAQHVCRQLLGEAARRAARRASCWHLASAGRDTPRELGGSPWTCSPRHAAEKSILSHPPPPPRRRRRAPHPGGGASRTSRSRRCTCRGRRSRRRAPGSCEAGRLRVFVVNARETGLGGRAVRTSPSVPLAPPGRPLGCAAASAALRRLRFAKRAAASQRGSPPRGGGGGDAPIEPHRKVAGAPRRRARPRAPTTDVFAARSPGRALSATIRRRTAAARQLDLAPSVLVGVGVRRQRRFRIADGCARRADGRRPVCTRRAAGGHRRRRGRSSACSTAGRSAAAANRSSTAAAARARIERGRAAGGPPEPPQQEHRRRSAPPSCPSTSFTAPSLLPSAAFSAPPPSAAADVGPPASTAAARTAGTPRAISITRASASIQSSHWWARWRQSACSGRRRR